jgi:hypothetical protein
MTLTIPTMNGEAGVNLPCFRFLATPTLPTMGGSYPTELTIGCLDTILAT